jgi:hypothetical protein
MHLKGYASITASYGRVGQLGLPLSCAGRRDADGGCEPGGLIPSPGSIPGQAERQVYDVATAGACWLIWVGRSPSSTYVPIVNLSSYVSLR